MIRVRQGTVADADVVGALHTRSRQDSYRGIIPDEVLARIDPREEGRKWAGRFNTQAGDHRLLIAESLIAEAQGRAIGFAYVGDGTLHAIHVVRAAQGMGAGRALMRAARAALVDLGHDQVELWVIAGNDRACRFYEKDGWRRSGETRDREIYGSPTHQLQYVRSLRVRLPQSLENGSA